MKVVSTLLQSASFVAEKIVKRTGRLDVIVVVTLDAVGKKLFYEHDCYAAPKESSDEEILSSLAAELQDDFKSDGVYQLRYLLARRSGTPDEECSNWNVRDHKSEGGGRRSFPC